MTTLTEAEMERGIILLWCLKCEKTTKHVTIGKHFGRRGSSHYNRRRRTCLECGNLVTF